MIRTDFLVIDMYVGLLFIILLLMKSIISSDELDGKIAKAEKLHKKLVEILNHDKSKSTQITDSHP